MAAGTWLRGSRLGLAVIALVVGAGAGLGAAGFRWLIFAITWLATGHDQFGQQGRVASLHLAWLGQYFVLVVPVIGGLLYGPLLQRFAPEARGHGVPEVMVAVAENGGRIRPPVALVKALASALCIGTGGSVGREGPIVQIGSAFASSLGQAVRVSETRLRIIVACGAAGGIAATFNAPITGLFFGFEIILREFSLDALVATSLAAVSADLVSRGFFGSAPFFSAIPHDLVITHDYTYLLVAVLGLASGLVGYGFKSFLYRLEDVADGLWAGRPEWARPAVGGIALGALLLALPEMYGVGYPVMDKAIAGHIVLWLLLVLVVGKVVAASLTLSIGGSGGVFAPSLFTGAMAGMAFGSVAHHLFGSVVSSPAIFGVVAMGAVFGAAAQAPLTAMASVVEMTGNFTLVLPVMLATAIAAALSKQLSHGNIYTTKLLRRGIDIERPKPASVLSLLTVADVMRPLSGTDGARAARPSPPARTGRPNRGRPMGPGPRHGQWHRAGPRPLRRRAPLSGFAPAGPLWPGRPTGARPRRPSPAGLGHSPRRTERLGRARELGGRGSGGGHAGDRAQRRWRSRPPAHEPTGRLRGGRGHHWGRLATLGSRLGQLAWPPGCVVVAVTEGRDVISPRPDIELRAGERVVLLAPARHGASDVGRAIEP